MNGVYLRFYVHENRRVHGRLLYEWLLERGRQLGIGGGTALKAMASYGRNGVLHEAKFFELAGDLTVEVGFVASEEQAAALLDAVSAERISIFYSRVAAEFGVVDGEA